MKVTELFDKFQKERNSCLNVEQFGSMLLMYPALCVATADGIFDELEKRNIVSSLKEASGNDDFVTCEMYAEMSYLIKSNIGKDIFDCLKEEVANNDSYKSIIKDLMTSVASVSNGISDIEQKKMDEIKKMLNI